MEGTWYYVYILRSLKNGSLYTGFTTNLRRRISFHNEGITKSTKHNRPWEIILAEAFINEHDARLREKFYKSGIGRNVLRKKLSNTLSPS